MAVEQEVKRKYKLLTTSDFDIRAPILCHSQLLKEHTIAALATNHHDYIAGRPLLCSEDNFYKAFFRKNLTVSI